MNSAWGGAGSASLILISTSDMQSGRQAHLDRMVASVRVFAEANADISVKLVLLLQRCDDEKLQAAKAAFPEWVSIVATSERMSLSKARNLLLSEIGAMGEADVVCFPDDDCWYPQATLEAIWKAFATNRALDFWFCRYSSDPTSAADVASHRPSLQETISRASSNTIVVRGRVANAIGGFDEGLGVGARLTGGEDTDYAIRAFYAAKDRLFVDAAAVGHRDPDIRFRATYYQGSLKAITRYSLKSFAAFTAACRKFAVGGWYVLSGHMPLRSYLGAIRAVVQTG